ncbi:MAG: hypothetical protein H7196_03815 [candidate division SR1 bacterium]|nr:hypothetical protein [candidate division SR1 bacterium]
MEQGNNFNTFKGRQKPIPFTTSSVFETQDDKVVRRLQNNIKSIQIPPLRQQTEVYTVDHEIIDAEIIDENFNESVTSEVSVNTSGEIVNHDSILDIAESDLAEIVASSSLSMEDRRKDELAEIGQKIEAHDNTILGLKNTKAILEKYLHVQESAIELNPELILSDSDRDNLTKIKAKIRSTEFDILTNMERRQHLINKAEGRYKYEVDKSISPYHDLVMTASETRDGEVINTIINTIKQDTKYEYNGREKIFIANNMTSRNNHSLPETAKNLLLNPNTTLEQAKKLVESVGNGSKPLLLKIFLEDSPLLNPLKEEKQSNTVLADANKIRSYQERVTPVMNELIEGLLYSTKQTAMSEINWTNAEPLRAAQLSNFSQQILKEKDPNKISLLEGLKKLGTTKLW